jgi:hypothetical protein
MENRGIECSSFMCGGCTTLPNQGRGITKEQTVKFEDFFDIMSQKVLEQQNSGQNSEIIFESHTKNVSCLFWQATHS